MSVESKIKSYNDKRSFLGFLTETKNDFHLYEGLASRLLSYLTHDTELCNKALLTFKSFRDDSSFDTEWVQILDLLIKKYRLNIDDNQFQKLFKVIPVEFHNSIAHLKR